eukprot:10175961-Lingulodinium_polyedra.AAC.1
MRPSSLLLSALGRSRRAEWQIAPGDSYCGPPLSPSEAHSGTHIASPLCLTPVKSLRPLRPPVSSCGPPLGGPPRPG